MQLCVWHHLPYCRQITCMAMGILNPLRESDHLTRLTNKSRFYRFTKLFFNDIRTCECSSYSVCFFYYDVGYSRCTLDHVTKSSFCILQIELIWYRPIEWHLTIKHQATLLLWTYNNWGIYIYIFRDECTWHTHTLQAFVQTDFRLFDKNLRGL